MIKKNKEAVQQNCNRPNQSNDTTKTVTNAREKPMTQCQRVLDYIDKHGSITTMEAFKELGITRLSGRVFDLNKRGEDIRTIMVQDTNRYGEKVRFARYYNAKGDK